MLPFKNGDKVELKQEHTKECGKFGIFREYGGQYFGEDDFEEPYYYVEFPNNKNILHPVRESEFVVKLV